MEYTLHKTPEGFIITSDEQAKEGELGYINFQGGDIKIVGKYFADDWKKVIAQQDQIDFSGLPEEEQKEIGWFNLDNLWYQFRLENPNTIGGFKEQYESFKWLFQKSEKLLSDRRFTLEDIENTYYIGFDDSIKGIADFEKLVKSLSQQSWKIELEMETKCYCGHTITCDCGQIQEKEFFQIPKLTNGKIKILKIY